jgi:Protein of unknown function (DUF455)
VIYEEEISHCAAGVRWLRYLHAQAWDGEAWPWDQGDARAAGSNAGTPPPETEAGGSAGGPAHVPDWVNQARQHETVESWFHALIRAHFHGPLKPPFNDAARARAGFGPEWYLPLAGQPREAADERPVATA